MVTQIFYKLISQTQTDSQQLQWSLTDWPVCSLLPVRKIQRGKKSRETWNNRETWNARKKSSKDVTSFSNEKKKRHWGLGEKRKQDIETDLHILGIQIPRPTLFWKLWRLK